MLKAVFLALCFIAMFLALVVVDGSVGPKVPFHVNDGLYDGLNSPLKKGNNPSALGLKYPDDIEHISVFNAQENLAQYNHGAVLFAFKQKLYAQWQSSVKDEDAADTRVLYSVSHDGRQWSAPKVLATSTADALVTNGGWWSDGNTLVSYLNVWPHDRKPKGGYVEYKTSQDGVHWSTAKRLRLKNNDVVEGVIEQDLKLAADNTIITALHTHPGLIVKPFYTRDPLGISDWVIADMPNLPFAKNTSRAIEPSWFKALGDKLVMVFRDQASSFKVLASQSLDMGKTWSLPMLTNMPDARAKLSAGNLPNGWAYIVNCPSGNKQRMPLVLSLSRDGEVFDQAYLLRSRDEVGTLKFQGKYKRLGFSYPKSIVWRGSLWVSYGFNKENIVITKVPIASLY